MVTSCYATMGELANLAGESVMVSTWKHSTAGISFTGTEAEFFDHRLEMALKDPDRYSDLGWKFQQGSTKTVERKTGADYAQQGLTWLTTMFGPKPPSTVAPAVEPVQDVVSADSIANARAAAKAKKTNMMMLAGAGVVGAIALIWALK